MKKVAVNSGVFILTILFLFLTVPPLQSQPQEKTIEIHAKRFEFVPAEITLTKGQTVKLKLISDDVMHSLVIPKLGVKSDMKVGEASEVTVTPTETGDFRGECGKFCGSGHGKMKFAVHVVDGK